MKKEYTKQVNKEVIGGIKSLYSSLKLPKIKRKNTDTKESAVTDDTDIPEFKKRYSNVRLTATICMAICIYCYYTLFNASGTFAFIVSLLSSIMLTMFYLTLSYTCWRARKVATDWSNRNKPLSTTYMNFFVSIVSKPSDLFPVRLKFKQ